MTMNLRTIAMITLTGAPLLMACGAAAADDCTPQSPCKMTLYMLPGGSPGSEAPVHLAYGDTLTLVFDGNKTDLVADVENWEDNNINLKQVDLWLPGALPGEGRIIPAWEFKVKSKKTDHVPPDREHVNIHLYKNPDSEGPDWLVTDALHSDGGRHGGTAHMTQ